MDNFQVAAASAADMLRIAECAAAEGWNPGDGDADSFFPADPRGFLVGRLDGKPITSISAIRYGPDFGFIGLYITRPELRGQGYGLRTWQAGMRRLAGRNVALDGVVAQQDNYRRSGFVSAWNNIRYQGLPGIERDRTVTLTDARTLGFDDLAAYDRRFFPAERDAFLAGWIAQPGHRCLAAVRDGRLAGLGVRRPSREAYRIGPLYADGPEVAAALLTALADDDQVVLDVPDANPAAVELAERCGLKPLFETARMYTGGIPDIDRAGMFAVTTLELG
jgi:hypothetical protein